MPSTRNPARSSGNARAPDPATLEKWAICISQVAGAITDRHGADCILYAGLGALVLQRLGFSARPVYGSASWRVGPGDGDVISHAFGTQTSSVVIPALPAGAAAGMMHAWIEVDERYIVDFTTASLPDKARMLDAADGGHTQVDWAPPALWLDKAQVRTLREVAQAAGGGVCFYMERADVTRWVGTRQAGVNYDGYVAAALSAISAMDAGHRVQVVGLRSNGSAQTLETACRATKALHGAAPLSMPIDRYDTPRLALLRQ